MTDDTRDNVTSSRTTGAADEAGAPPDPFRAWAEAHARMATSGEELLWPSETLIRIVRGAYIPGIERARAGARVLDVGCGNGNNLVFFATLGMELAGTEVDPSICEATGARLATLGYRADLRVGTNRNLPFAAGSFDLLVSWNVLHYEDDEPGIRLALEEYRRVLRPGGRLLLSTTAPEHKLLDGAERIAPCRVRITRTDDFRRGHVFFLFESEAVIRGLFGPRFADLRIGRTSDRLFTETLDWWLVTGVRPA